MSLIEPIIPQASFPELSTESYISRFSPHHFSKSLKPSQTVTYKHRTSGPLIPNSKMANEYTLDLEELRQLRSIAKRPRILSLINTEITNLEKSFKESSAPAVVALTATPIPTPVKAPVVPSVNYSALSTFSWDQDGDKVKIYISLAGVDQEKLEADFKRMSVDVKFHGVEGKNYRFSIPKLHKEIVPESCKVIVKPSRVIISLFKASKGNWLDLHYKEDKLKPGMDKEKDPMSGIMDLMKNMYEEGDEEMKKTIAKAWTDARTGKADPMKGFR